MKLEKWRNFFWGSEMFVFGNMALINIVGGDVSLGLLFTLLFGAGAFFVIKPETHDMFLQKKKKPIMFASFLSIGWLLALFRWIFVYRKFKQIPWAVDFYGWSIGALYIGVLLALVSAFFVLSKKTGE